MSQSYHPLDSSLGSSNAPQPVPIASMAGPGANTQITEEPGVARFSDEVQSLSTSSGADYPALFAPVENDTRTQENEWIPGFGKMDPLTRRDALNHYLQTPKFTFEGIVRAYLQQQQQQQIQSQHEAQKAASERDAMEREMRMRSEQQRKISRLDGPGPGPGPGYQPRRF